MNLAEIRKKAQQAKEAQQLLAEEQEQEQEKHPEQALFEDAYPDYIEDGEPFDDGEQDLSVAEEDLADDVPEQVAVERPIAPEDIFPEPAEVVLHAPEPPALELVTQNIPAVLPLSAVQEEPPSSDPVAVLLRGREQAGRDEDAFIGPSSGEQADDANSQEFLCFKVSSEEYALSIMRIKEIIKPREVTEVPRVPSFVSGVLSLRGIIIPIFDMSMRLGLPKGAPTGKERIVVVNHGEEGFSGIYVDEVVQVVRIEDRHLEPPPTVLEGIDRDFVSGIGRFGGRMLILLNMDKILDITLF